MFSPSSGLKYVRDNMYCAAYGFAVQHGKQVTYYRLETRKGSIDTYALLFIPGASYEEIWFVHFHSDWPSSRVL